eukprot:gnl/MRDRNA2_/MRDRNA2_82772_c0_seq2.p1 gnl/MRDRNA2_/MRDRNA2_82772_c0~~gnl/MRDRNA2_/MRDRNA2_82772_c0_seq2.p1  ORF type:complete len:421 (-),score=72.86 gnl/MRDRNA2_/MRDRNA2_82772_c0_seq2:238-1500(-)
MKSACLLCIVLSVQALKRTAQLAAEGNEQKSETALKESWEDSWESESSHMIYDEIKPSDFKATMYWNRLTDVAIDFMPKVMYGLGNCAILSVIVFIYYDRGFVNVMAIMGLVMSLSMMSNTIQAVYHLGFKYPEFITACHQLFSCVTAFTVLQSKRLITGQSITYPESGTIMKFIAPIAICFGLSLGFSNLGLMYSNTHFYEMLTPMSGVLTFIMGYYLGKITNLKLVGPVVLVAGALPLVAFGELKPSLLGFFFAFLGVFFRSSKAQLNSMLMSGGGLPQTFHPLELTCWTGVLTCLVMLTWSAFQEGVGPYAMLFSDGNSAPIICAMLVSCINATVLNICVLFVMREVGPVAQQIIGELKGSLACVGAVAAFGEEISVMQIAGYILAISGVFLYNKMEMDIRAEEAAEKEKLMNKENA